MKNDVPAAQPLTALIAGLACGPLLVNPWLTVFGLVILTFRFRTVPLFAALGIVLALHSQPTLIPLDESRFTIIEAPIEREWASRDHGHVLRASRFTADGQHVDEAIAIYARFEPPPVAMEKYVRVEAFLRRNERGLYTAVVKSPVLLTYTGALRKWHPFTWNRILAQRLAEHADEHPTAVALAHALVLGRGERLSGELRDSYIRGGTYHLIVFSGLQITFAAAILAMLLRWLHRPRASDWLLLSFALVAPLFIGPTASVSRASIGIALYALARILKRPTSIENLWCVAALLRLILEPRDLYDASFHLTYAGAAAVLFVGKAHDRTARILTAALGAELALTPLTLHHFGQFALGGSLLTLLMSPVIFTMLGVSALAFAFPCDALFELILLLHRLCALMNLASASGSFTAPPVWSLILGFAGALFAIAMLRKRARAWLMIAALLIPNLAAVGAFLARRSVEHPRVTFFDVGQGDAIAIRSKKRTILVDGGPEGPLVPLLLARGIRTLDAVILTHAHPDHCGGVIDAVKKLHVKSLWISPRRFRGDCATRLLESHVPIHLVRDGDTLALDGVTVTAILSSTAFRRAPENNASVVLRVETQQRRILLTGDIEAEAEIDLEDRDLRADVLKVAHHGSRTSTRNGFLERVQPRIAVISCGRRNLFGHPHPAVLERLGQHDVRVHRTDLQGSIDVDVEHGRLYVRARKD